MLLFQGYYQSHIGPIIVDPSFESGYCVYLRSFQKIKKNTREEFAVKVIRKESIGMDQRAQMRIEREVEILTKVNHPNIVRLYDIIESETRLYLIMELVTGGELFDKIVAKGYYSEKDACLVIKHVVGAIKYLHEQRIAHRDLKPENLLLKGKDDTQVMISDFGLSRVLGDSSMAYTACGTPYYVAPEVVSGQGYGKEVDLWSIGVIAYFLLAGFPPFMGDTLPEIVEQILNADYDFPEPYWDNVSDSAKDFISKLLVTDKTQRMTSELALDHPWIKNISSASSKPLNNKLVKRT